MSEEKRANIRNSTAEFLIFTGQSGENSIEVRVADESVWLTQKLMGTLFEVALLKDFAIRGYLLDKERLKNGSFFNKAYFDNLIEEVREIRASERKFY